MLRQNNNRGACYDVLQTLLLIEAPITPAEILSMVNMDTTLSSVLGNTQQQLPRYFGNLCRHSTHRIHRSNRECSIANAHNTMNAATALLENSRRISNSLASGLSAPVRPSAPVRSYTGGLTGTPIGGYRYKHPLSAYPGGGAHSSFGQQALDRWHNQPECPLCGLELQQLAASVDQQVQIDRSRDRTHFQTLLENERRIHKGVRGQPQVWH